MEVRLSLGILGAPVLKIPALHSAQSSSERYLKDCLLIWGYLSGTDAVDHLSAKVDCLNPLKKSSEIFAIRSINPSHSASFVNMQHNLSFEDKLFHTGFTGGADSSPNYKARTKYSPSTRKIGAPLKLVS